MPAALSVFGAIGPHTAFGAFFLRAYFGRSPFSVCGVGVHVRVGVAVGCGVGVGVAFDFYVCVAICFASRIHIGMRVDTFVCVGRLRLRFVGARGRVRTRFPHIHFYVKCKNE